MADNCTDLAAQIAALATQVGRLNVLTEAQVRQIVDSITSQKIQPLAQEISYKIDNQQATGIVTQQTTPLSQQLAGVKTQLNGIDNEIERALQQALARTLSEIKSDITGLKGKVNSLSGRVGTAEHVANNAIQKAVAVEKTAEDAARDAELSKRLSIQSKSESAEAKTNASTASTEAKAASNEAKEAKGLFAGFSNRMAAVEGSVTRLSARVGEVAASALEAIGVSRGAQKVAAEALGKVLAVAGAIAEIFTVIAAIQEIIAQIKTLEILGERIDAIENGLVALGADVSGILGRLLGLQNRIAANTASISETRGIAIDAKGIGEAANLKAGSALEAARGAQSTADTASSKATQAQITADGAVRNAAQANANATIAYQKATIAQTTATNAQGKAEIAEKTATEAKGIGQKALDLGGSALNKAGEAFTIATTALALYYTLKGLKGLKGDKGDRGFQGIPGRDGVPGITTVVQIPGIPGRDGAPGRDGRNGFGIPGRDGKPGINGIPGRDGKDGKDVNPADLAGLKALIVQQHTQTRASATSAIGGLKQFVTGAFGALTALTTAIGSSVIFSTALNVITFATTMHNAFMLSNNLAQTLGTIIDQVLAFILPKGLDGTPINIGNVLGKAAHEIIADAIGEANYKTITDDWAKANRIYQAGVNVFNQVGNAVGLLSAGMEVIGGNVAKIGNALKIWGVVGQKAYALMNPQPNMKGKFFDFINSATAEANTIQMMVAIPIGLSAAAIGINDSVAALNKQLDQKDPVDMHGNPILDRDGTPLKYQPGITVPDPTKTIAAQVQAKADSTNIIEATIDDIFNAND